MVSTGYRVQGLGRQVCRIGLVRLQLRGGVGVNVGDGGIKGPELGKGSF